MEDVLDVDVAFNGGLRELLRYTSYYNALSFAGCMYNILATPVTLPEVQGLTDIDSMLNVLYLTSRESPVAGLVLYNGLVFAVAFNVCSWLAHYGFGDLRREEFVVRPRSPSHALVFPYLNHAAHGPCRAFSPPQFTTERVGLFIFTR